MDDLKDYEKQLAIIRGFIQDPNVFLLSMVKYLDGTEYQKERMNQIYNFFVISIVESATINDFIEKMSNTSNPQSQSQLNAIKSILMSNKELFPKLKNYINELGYELKLRGINEKIIRENESVPISEADNVFLNKLSRSTITGDNDGFTPIELEKEEFKTKVSKLFHEIPYYFEQAFSNTELKVQAIILDCIRDRYEKGNPKQEEEFRNLEDLYMLADIDKLIVKIKNPTSMHQAFQKILGILYEGEKRQLLNKILKENIIMRSLFQIDPKNPFHGFSKMFINSKYPYNGILIDKYRNLMFKSEEELKEIIERLKKDDAFAKQYEIYLNIKATIDKKRRIENIFNTIENRNRMEKKSDIISLYNLLLSEDLSKEVISSETITEYSNKVSQIIVKEKLNLDPAINSKVDEYFIAKLDQYLHPKKISLSIESANDKKTITRFPVVQSISALDVWYDTNKILSENKVNNYETIYLKYNEKYAYVFEPMGELKVSNRELPLVEIRVLPQNTECIICAETDEKLFNLFDLYINRIYQRIYKVAFKDKIKFVDKKNVNNKKSFTQSDENQFKKIVYDYAAIVYIVKKDPKFFKDFYKSRAKELLKEIISFEKNYSDILENVILETDVDYKNIFSDIQLLNRLYSEIDTIDVSSNIQEFFSITSNENLEKNRGIAK